MEQKLAKPEWLKIKVSANDNFSNIKNTLKQHNLHTVCEEAHCPNISECWSGGTATFMLMGDMCTRGCKFCAVKTGNPMQKLDEEEPKKLAQALKEIKLLDYVVLTSVNRDDLVDGGSGHFAECIREIKKAYPEIIVEVLIPDFNGSIESLNKIVDAKPEVIAHNIETVERLQKKVRDVRANYKQSLSVLENVKKLNPKIIFVNPTASNNTYTTGNYVLVNVSINETNFANLTISLYNSSLTLINNNSDDFTF